MKKKTVSFYKIKYRSMLFSATFNMAISSMMLLCDNIIAGQVIGVNGVAAVNMVAPLIVFSSFIASCISEGVFILYTRAIGAMNRKRADQLYGMGVIATAVLAVLVGVSMFVFREAYFLTTGETGIILEYAREYYLFLPLNSVFLIIFDFVEQAVFADGDERLVTLGYSVQIIVHIFLSFILSIQMGIRGTMLGTTISSGLALFIASLHFLKKTNTLHFVPYFSLRDLIQSVKYSITDAIIYLLWGVMDYVLISYIGHHYEESYQTIMAVVFSLIELALIFDGIGMAIQPLIGVYFGEKNHVMIKRLMKDAIYTAIVEGLVGMILIYLFAPQFAWLFGIRDESMLEAAVTAIRIVALTFPGTSLFMLETAYYLYIDHIGFSVAAICLKDGLLSTLLPILVSTIIGVNGLWIGYAAASALGLILSMLALYIYAGKARFPSLLDSQGREIIVLDKPLTPEDMTEASREIERLMEEHNYPKQTAKKAALFVEEISATILEKNGDDKVFMEYSLIFEEQRVSLVIRDSGIIFDITDPNLEITGLSSFVINGLLSVQKEKDYLTTTGYNRNMIRMGSDS